MEPVNDNYLTSIKKLFRYYKTVGDAAIERTSEEGLHWRYNDESNSLAIIIKHVSGNSLSRWSDFLQSDGEKASRDRDDEFEDNIQSKQELTDLWERGWQCLFDSIDTLTGDDLMRITYIRNEGHTVTEAINRQLAHIPYHIGQMVALAKMMAGENWQSLTIPKGASKAYNSNKFSGDKKEAFFTDGLIGTK